jgi:hypothetical protein
MTEFAAQVDAVRQSRTAIREAAAACPRSRPSAKCSGCSTAS